MNRLERLDLDVTLVYIQVNDDNTTHRIQPKDSYQQVIGLLLS